MNRTKKPVKAATDLEVITFALGVFLFILFLIS